MHILTLDTGLGITMRITLILVIYTLLCVQGICSTSSKFLQISTLLPLLLPLEGRHLMHFMYYQRKGILYGFIFIQETTTVGGNLCVHMGYCFMICLNCFQL